MVDKINAWLYPKELKDFINNDLKIKIKKTRNFNEYHFVSKRELATFKIMRTPKERPLKDIDFYQFADLIFFEILNLKENDEIF